MILWTIVPVEWVLEEDGPSPPLMDVAVGALRLVLEAGADGSARIHRVLSTDPADYLRPELQPGAPWSPGPWPGAGWPQGG
ncbi:MAG TPA: YlzJ-like family protein [Limnochordales bacterium]|nr:YlzJ-like family protein [Limnochordales bacterium]